MHLVTIPDLNQHETIFLSLSLLKIFFLCEPFKGASLLTWWVKNLPVNTGHVKDVGLIPGWEDPLGEAMAVYSSILA